MRMYVFVCSRVFVHMPHVCAYQMHVTLQGVSQQFRHNSERWRVL